MIWDFMGCRTLPTVGDYLVSIEGVLNCEITCQKFGDSLCEGIREFSGYNFVKQGKAKILIIYLRTKDPRSKPQGPGRLGSAAHEILKIIESPLL